MGYDLLAYIDVDQSEVEDLARAARSCPDEADYVISNAVCSRYAERHFKEDERMKCMMMYSFNEDCRMHEMYVSHHLNFIRDDTRFENPRFHRMLETKTNKEFPECLTHICWGLRTRENALDVAQGLESFFADDVSLASFANWLRVTARYCSTYELSY